MLLRKTYGIDLGSSSIKVYSFFKNKSYMEKNMIASKGRRIIAVGNEAYDMFEKAPANIVVNSPPGFHHGIANHFTSAAAPAAFSELRRPLSGSPPSRRASGRAACGALSRPPPRPSGARWPPSPRSARPPFCCAPLPFLRASR